MKTFVMFCAVAAMALTASDAHARKCCAKTKRCNTGCGQVSTCCAQTAPAPCQVAACTATAPCQTASCCKTRNTCHAKPCCNAAPACAVTPCCTTGTTPVAAKPYEEVKAPEVPAPAPAQ